MGKLEGKVAVITGGSTGIGLATTQPFAAAPGFHLNSCHPQPVNAYELADLTMAIAAINAWNRMAISFRNLPGGYQPGQFNHLLERQAH